MQHGNIPELEHIDFDIHVNNDGSLNVEENWYLFDSNSYIISINLQMKNLTKDDISDLKIYRNAGTDVIDFVSGDFNIDTIKTGNYSVIESGDTFTILCGIGRYKDFTISYKVKDKVTLYGDCADVQLELLDRSLGIDVDTIKGQVYYPSVVVRTGVISAWEKHSDINSELTKKDTEKISFVANEIDESGVRVRVLLPISLFGEVKNISKDMMQDTIISQENNDVLGSSAKNTILNLVFSLIVGFTLIIMIQNTFKYIKQSGKVFNTQPTKKIKYSRELPFDNITPGQAAFIKDSGRAKMGDVFAATILGLQMKGAIDIVYTGEKNKLGNTFIKILDIKPELTVEEEPVFDFLVDCMEKFQKSDLMISLNMLQKYVSDSSEGVSKLKSNMQNAIKKSIASYDSQADKIINKRLKGIIIYFVIIALMLIIPTKLFDVAALRLWTILVAIVNIIFCVSIVTKLSIFDQEGIDHREKLRALENYMLEFSNFKQKGVPEISIWEYYIIFAISFGISKKVLEQINSCYPNIEDTAFMNSYILAKNLEKCNFQKGFLFAIPKE